jgi:Tol biopolymer transport system component
VAFSYRRSFDPAQTRVLIDSRRGDGLRRQVYELNAPELYVPLPGERGARRLTFSDSQSAKPSGPDAPRGFDDYNPSVSPDGTKLVYVSTSTNSPTLHLMSLAGGRPSTLSNLPSGCTLQVPTWSPDGRTLSWEQQCPGGRFAVMRGDLNYVEDNSSYVEASLMNVRALTDQSSDNRYPRVSPDGTKITFTSYRDGNAEIYVMLSNGANQTRLTTSPSDDEAATWRADGQQLAFASNRDGNFEIYTMNADGANQTRLTNSPAQDRWPLWAQ